MLNEFIFTGYMHNEPNQYVDFTGNPYIVFRLSGQRDHPKTSQKYDHISFHAIGRTAELILKYVKPGQCITVRGVFQSGTRSFETGRRTLEYHNVRTVYFDRMKDPPTFPPEDQDPAPFEKALSGLDENGLFPSDEDPERSDA